MVLVRMVLCVLLWIRMVLVRMRMRTMGPSISVASVTSVLRRILQIYPLVIPACKLYDTFVPPVTDLVLVIVDGLSYARVVFVHSR